MGASADPVLCTDTTYLHRLIIIYQLISKDKTLQSLLSAHGSAAPRHSHEAFGAPLDSWRPCNLCDGQLHTKAAADVSALRRLLCPSASAAAASAATTEEIQEEVNANAADTGLQGAAAQVQQGGATGSEGPPSTAASTTDEAPKETEEGPQEVSECSAAPPMSEPLVLAYDPSTGKAVPHSPSGISAVSSPIVSPATHVVAPTGPPRCRAGRIFVDGVFDLLHSGHFNALRQARQLGRRLVVGVNSDRETFAAKGCWPIYTQEERAEIVASCKWVDEVVIGTPYEVTTDLLDALSCEAAAHGDDLVVGADGRDAYALPRAAGRMLVFRRTEGISSTRITRRLLEATSHMCEGRVAIARPQSVGHFARQALQESEADTVDAGESGGPSELKGQCSLHTGEARGATDALQAPVGKAAGRPSPKTSGPPDTEGSKATAKPVKRQGDWSVFMSSKRLLQFIGEARKPKPGDRVVYVDGSFDVLHVGHVRILKIAKEMGDYLIVGIHDDATVSAVKGPGFPVMNVNERALNVLAMRMVDEVIIGAPWTIPKYLLEMFGIHIVVRGTRIDCTADTAGSVPRRSQPSALCTATDRYAGGASDAPGLLPEDEDPYRVPKELGIYREVESFSSWTTRELVSRLIRNRQALSDSLRHREMKESHFWMSLPGQTARLAAEL